LIALIVTINQFKAWAEAKNMWNTPPSREVPQLYSEWRKCLTGLPEQNWLEIEGRLVAPSTSKTFTLFKKCLSGFIVKKVAHDDDAYFMQKDYLNERNLPANTSFNDYYDRLRLYSSYMIWLLDVRQIVRLKNIQDPFGFTRECATLELLWSRPNDNEDPTGPAC
jgi:hypothetical protein